MKVLRSLDEAKKENIKACALTIGSFDGVHRGHAFLLQRLHEISPKAPQVVITFDPHPAEVLSQRPFPRLFSMLDQEEMFAAAGVDYLYFLPFTAQVAELSAEDFAKTFIFDLFRPEQILVGYDFAFGKGRKGDFPLLQKLAESFHCSVHQASAFKIQGLVVSSSRVREAVKKGAMDEAIELLGRPFYLQGEVMQGRKLGRTIGIPTANLKTHNLQIMPNLGVYFCKVNVVGAGDSKDYFALTNVGTNPTVTEDLSVKVETYILDFDQDLYGQTIKVEFYQKIREEMKFESLEVLKKHIQNDIAWARQFIAQNSLSTP